MPPPSRAHPDRWIGLGLAAAVLAVFGQVRSHGFINFDDPEYVVEHPLVRRGLTWDGVGWALTGIHSATWHPLTSLSHMLDVQLFGLHAGSHLLVNVALHAASAVLLFAALRRLTGARWPSALVAALFALHPLHVESVAWVSERKDVLSTLFWMLTLLAFAAYAERPSLGRYGLVLLAFALGLTAKPMLVTLPFVLLLLDWWPLERISAAAATGLPAGTRPTPARVSAGVPAGTQRTRAPVAAGVPARFPRLPLLEKLPLLLLAAAVSVVTLWAQRQAGAIVSTDDVPLAARLANALITYATFVVKTVAPVGLAPFYPLHLPLPPWQVAGSAALVAGISAAVLAAARRHPYLLVGWCWYLGTMVPVVGLVKQGEQAMADRFSYVPQIGLFIMIAWGAAELAAKRRWPQRAVAAVAAAALAACAVLTARQVARWRDSETLFRHALAVTERNYLAHFNLGAALYARGDADGARAEFSAAHRIRPNYAKVLSNLGMVEAARGDAAAALGHYEAALRADPRSALAHFNLAVLFGRLGRGDEARAHYEAAIAIDPWYAQAHNTLGLLLAERGDRAAAIAAYRAALAARPDLAPAHANLAIALEQDGRDDDALRHFEAAARLAPSEPLAHLNLGAALAARGRRDDAVRHLREALRLRPDLGDARAVLAQLGADTGETP